MKLQHLTAFVILATAVLTWGCGSSKTDESSSTTSPSTQGADTQKPSGAGKAASLGTAKSNEHFTVTLTAVPSELRVGKARFIAKLLHHGQPTDAAKVKLSLSQPAMNMGGPEVELQHAKDGIYEGALDLSMGGDWQAKVSMEQEGHPGEAIYDFVVSQ
ncbi:MAG: FixH family protein [Fimbriimonadales bacterium]